MSKDKKIVMISSTARDLPEHRKEVMDACLRQGMFPKMMEHLPASDDEAISASLAMVDEADFYLGIFAHRYGYVPKGHDISVTEMEYNRAVERKIPRLIFLMGKDHPIKFEDVEMGEAATKLQAFKDRVGKENIVSFFNSPADLRAHVINSLSQLRVPDLTAFHYVSDIPAPPEPFIAHPYTLLQTHRLVGRQPELNLLTDWVAKPQSAVYQARILNVVAIGGMGKSALTWKWFNEIAPQEMKPLAGRMWWSFYESDATFENFVTRALAYVTRRPLGEVEQIPAPEREAQLLSTLDREPFLLVLDGLERMLIAYARMDAAHLSDDDYDRQTANYVANAIGLPASAAQSFTGEHRLRKTADPRAGAFLRKLTTVRTTRVLVSTRLYPADLQMVTGEALGTCFAAFLPGLAEDDALELWRAFGAKGSRDQLLPVFRSVENHPLLIQSLAGEVARFRRAPGDFDAWLKAHLDFNPFRDIPLVQVKSHVLEFALRGLDERARQILYVLAAFRMPASYDTLTALLIGEAKPCASEQELDAVLAEVEDRGLVGWDKRANRYDLHPIVRGVVWSRLGDDGRRGVYANLHAHFEAAPKIEFDNVSRLEDLTPAIELYNTLIGLGRFDDAFIVFLDRLSDVTLYRLSANRQRVELLELLFPDGVDQSPRLRNQGHQAYTLNTLALGYQFIGQPGRAAPLFRRACTICSEIKQDADLSVGLYSLSNVLRLLGALCEAESAARRALVITRVQENLFREANSLYLLGLALSARGKADESLAALQLALRIFIAQPNNIGEGLTNAYLAQRALWCGALVEAHACADRAWKLAHVMNYERDFIRAARVQGAVALGLDNFAVADERLHHALTRARQANLVEEELPALIALAELRRREGKLGEARELLADVWNAAECGPYPLHHADACNILAQLERDAGNTDAAIEAATQAYRLAWCDGPPFAYHWGLEAARRHLRELGAPEPELPPFDPSEYEPMPEVEINPRDEFYVEVGADDGAEA
jgi:tetratricopeptide (TPR) repeat protein